MYIHSVCSISALQTITARSSTPDLKTLPDHLDAVPPDYKQWIAPMQLRRMSNGLKMGIAAAKICLEQTNITAENIAAISVGTAYGMLQDSESFLAKMIAQQEAMLNPTAFIQSTHNTVAGAIALMLGSYVHNMTFVHKGHSFESALLDAEMMLDAHAEKQVLLGAIDEKTNTLNNLLHHCHPEVKVGEGAAFLLLGNAAQGAICQLKSYHFFKEQELEKAVARMKSLLPQNAELIVAATDENVSFENAIYLNNHIGYNPTGSALALVFAVNRFQENKNQKFVIAQFEDYWSVYELI